MHLSMNSWRRQEGDRHDPVVVLPASVGRCTGRFLPRIKDFTLIWEGARVADSNRGQRSPHLWETGRRDGLDFIRRMWLMPTLPRPVHLNKEFVDGTGFLAMAVEATFPHSPHDRGQA